MMVERLPGMMLLLTYYLAFTYTLSFCIACMAFFMNRAYSLTPAKNMMLWALSGEMIPLDLYPEPFRNLLLHSPFASGVYIPVAYITGRIGHDLFLQSFVSITGGMMVAGGLAYGLWKMGMKSYTGTGA